MKTNNIYLKIAGGGILAATLENNLSSEALVEQLEKGDLTVSMEDYAGMEKVGSLGIRLPRNDRPIATTAGDLILYQGHNFVIYYDTNSWNFTRLGRINGKSGKELLAILGRGDVKITLSLNK